MGPRGAGVCVCVCYWSVILKICERRRHVAGIDPKKRKKNTDFIATSDAFEYAYTFSSSLLYYYIILLFYILYFTRKTSEKLCAPSPHSLSRSRPLFKRRVTVFRVSLGSTYFCNTGIVDETNTRGQWRLVKNIEKTTRTVVWRLI